MNSLRVWETNYNINLKSWQPQQGSLIGSGIITGSTTSPKASVLDVPPKKRAMDTRCEKKSLVEESLFSKVLVRGQDKNVEHLGCGKDKEETQMRDSGLDSETEYLKALKRHPQNVD